MGAVLPLVDHQLHIGHLRLRGHPLVLLAPREAVGEEGGRWASVGVGLPSPGLQGELKARCAPMAVSQQVPAATSSVCCDLIENLTSYHLCYLYSKQMEEKCLFSLGDISVTITR